MVINSLPGGINEVIHLKNETLRALHVCWNRVDKLAKYLDRYGDVDLMLDKNAKKLLPTPFSNVKKWPKVPIQTVKQSTFCPTSVEEGLLGRKYQILER